MSDALGELLGALTSQPEKVHAYTGDTYVRESVDQLDRAGVDAAKFAREHSLLLLKPDAIVGRAVEPTLEWLADNGFRVVDADRVTGDRLLARALWYYSWNIASTERRAPGRPAGRHLRCAGARGGRSRRRTTRPGPAHRRQGSHRPTQTQAGRTASSARAAQLPAEPGAFARRSRRRTARAGHLVRRAAPRRADHPRRHGHRPIRRGRPACGRALCEHPGPRFRPGRRRPPLDRRSRRTPESRCPVASIPNPIPTVRGC